MITAVIVFLAYLLGSIPFAFLAGRFGRGIDIRQHGSGNVGATNVFRVMGPRWGTGVFILDVLKGALAVGLCYRLQDEAGLVWLPVAAGVLAILGHTFPVWLRFRGGKGVATSLGAFLALAPLPTGIAFALWIGVFSLSHIISIASLAAAIAFPVLVGFLSRIDPAYPYLLVISVILALFILFTHRSNMIRLMRGEEKKLF